MAKTEAEQAYDASVTAIRRVAEAEGTTLSLSGSRFRELDRIPEELSSLASLRNLILSKTAVSNLTPLKELSGLQSLFLNQTAVSDLAPLASLTALQSLSFEQTTVSDLAPLAGLTALRSLWLNQTKVSDLVPLAKLIGLLQLSVDKTGITDLTPLAGLTKLTQLSLRQTGVSDISPLSSLSDLRHLGLDSTKVEDLRPVSKLSKLGGFSYTSLSYWNTPVAASDAQLSAMASSGYHKKRTRETLAYLATLPPWPQPLPWNPPLSVADTAPSPPAPDAVPNVDISAHGLDLAASPIDPTDLTDPIKARLYSRLPDAVATLLRQGNRYPEVAGPAKVLADLTALPFDQADLLDIHLQLAALTDLRTADPGRPKPEELDPDCRLALDAVLRIGPGVTLGHPDVDALEDRLATYARARQPATVAEGERLVTSALAASADLASPRLRKVAGQVSQAGDEGRVAGYRRGLSRNVIRALGFVAVGLADAATGTVFGEVVLVAAQFLVLHRDAIMATAPAWGQTGYAWLEYILVRAELMLQEAKQNP
ncbi:MAG: leucine-rich repeat domain-containing protein [Paracoccaceae bacterium]